MRDEVENGKLAFSRPLPVAEVPPEGLEIEIVASDAERAALARLNAIPAVSSLSAKLTARRWRGDGVEIQGELRADVRQICVTTLEAFDSTVVEPVEVRFAPPRKPASAPARSRRGAPEPEPIEDPFGVDPPDPLVDGVVDLGAVASEFLTLALDPYPRKPGAAFTTPAPAEGDEKISPFARLKATDGEPPADG